MRYLLQDDPELAGLVTAEEKRLETTLNLIAAENHAPWSVNEVLGSVFNTKTIEGYPGNRFHAGCVHADQVENLARERGKKLFQAEYINVQPHSGTTANLAVYFSVLQPGDRILSMYLPHGGHLSHGHRASISSKCFDFSHYRIDPQTECIDYDQVREQALEIRPKMIIAGASSYPRLIDYERMAQIADEISAFFMVDMAHLAGLVAAKVIPSPVPFSDFITFTCYKTMIGGRGGVILCREKYGRDVDQAVFPGCQGTSAVNLIAAKALIFQLAFQENFIFIQKKTLENAKTLTRVFKGMGYRIVTGGTDNHQVLIDLNSKNISGKTAETCLEAAGFVLNRNLVPGDGKGRISGIRLGTGGLSARGMDIPEMETIARLMDTVMMNPEDRTVTARIREEVLELCRAFPINRQI